MVKKAEEAITDSRERTADTLFTDLDSVALASGGRVLNITEDTFVPTAKCRKAIGDQIRSSKTTVLCMPSPPRAGNEGTLLCSTVFRNSTSASTPLQGRCHCWRCQCGSIQILQKASTKICTILQFAVLLREMQREVNTGAQLIGDFILIIEPITIFLSFAHQVILIVASWLFPHEENYSDPES